MRPVNEIEALFLDLLLSQQLSQETLCRIACAPKEVLSDLARNPERAECPGVQSEIFGEGSRIPVKPKQAKRALALLQRRPAGLLPVSGATEFQQTCSSNFHSSTQLLSRWQPQYPRALLDLELPPPLLFVRGSMPLQLLGERPALAIVGPRRPDPWALRAAALFAKPLAEAGLLIISGFAQGIDGQAHRSALEVDGLTCAILGCGLNLDYPRNHRELGQQIEQKGLRLSEFPDDWAPTPRNFPIRNRVIAALSFATIVVQADLRSGSLITARLALELGREVFAMPGRVFDKKSRGANLLLRDGATPALDPEEMVEMFPLLVKDQLARHQESKCSADPLTQLSPEGKAPQLPPNPVLGSFDSDPLTAEEIANRIGWPVPRVLALVSQLEIEGRIERLSAGRFLPKKLSLGS